MKKDNLFSGLVVLIVIVLIAAAAWNGYNNMQNAETNYSRTSVGSHSRFIDEEYGVICYQTSNMNLDCLWLDDRKQGVTVGE